MIESDLLRSLEIGAGEIRGQLATALALERDVTLGKLVLGAGRVESRAGAVLALGPRGPYLRLDENTGLEPLQTPDDAEPVDLTLLLQRRTDVRAALEASIHDSGAGTEADRLLDAALRRGEQVTREDFRSLARWGDLLALSSYRLVAKASLVLDDLRVTLVQASAARDARSAAALRLYWSLVHGIANLTLIATAGTANDWLRDMALSFPWRNWTPSFALVRERMIRLAVRGGWAAAAFGEAVVAPYLEVLAQRRPMLHHFDASLGLAAIAIRHPGIAREVVRDVRKTLERRTAEDRGGWLPNSLSRSVAIAVMEPDRAMRVTLLRGSLLFRRLSPKVREALLSTTPDAASLDLLFALDDDRDGATVHDSGLFPAILALAACTNGPADAFYLPARLARSIRRTTRSPRIREALARTAPEAGAPTSPVLH